MFFDEIYSPINLFMFFLPSYCLSKLSSLVQHCQRAPCADLYLGWEAVIHPLNIPDNWMGQLFVLFQADFNFESISAYLISLALSRSPFWIPLCYGTCQAILSMFYLCLSTFGTQTKTFSFHANSWDVQSVPGSILSGSHNMDMMDFCPGPLPPVCLPVGGQWCPTG